MAKPLIRVSICIGWSDRQLMLDCELTAPCTVSQALAQAKEGLDAFDLAWQSYSVAIFGKLCKPEQSLHGGEQIELLRGLVADPNLARQRRVEVKRRQQGRSAWRRNARSQHIQTNDSDSN